MAEYEPDSQSPSNRLRPVRQRAIYSEILGESNPQARKMASSGPKGLNSSASQKLLGQSLGKRGMAHSVSAPALPGRSGVLEPLNGMPNGNGLGPSASTHTLMMGGSQRFGGSGTLAAFSPGQGKQAKPSLRSFNKKATFNATQGRKLPSANQHSALVSTKPQHKRGQTVQPKVVVPFEQQPGKLPRRLEIERKTRLYASQDINEMLCSNGVDYTQFPPEVDHTTGKRSYLPLDVFDDLEYEVRSPESWIVEGTDSDEQCAIEARALMVDSSHVDNGIFKPCKVIGFNSEERLFTIEWADGRPQSKLPRIHVNFMAEDPVTFVQRVVQAHSSRRTVEGDIRYSLYVDSMPTDEISPLETEQVNRILLLALNTKKLRQSALDTSSLLKEVNIDYARSMNKIIFDKNLNDPEEGQLRNQLNLNAITQDLKREVPYFGVATIPFHDFSRHFSDFCFHSFYTKSEAVIALRNTNIEDLSLVDSMSMFNVSINKSLRLEEYDSMQQTAINVLTAFLKEKWTAAAIKCIKSSMGGTGKGWFNLREKNREVYMMSKLKKFMRTVNFMMEDSLRFLVMKSLDQFLQFFTDCTNYGVEVHGIHNIEVRRLENGEPLVPQELEWEVKAAEREAAEKLAEEAAANAAPEEEDAKEGEGTEEKEEEAEEAEVFDDSIEPIVLPRGTDFPLFTTDLVFRDGEVVYTTEAESFISTPLNLFNKALSMLHNIPQIETSVMEHLLWHGNQPKLSSVGRDEDWVDAVHQTVSERLTKALVPMRALLHMFVRYTDTLNTDVDAYVDEWISDEPTIDEAQAEIQMHTNTRNKLDELLPKKVWLGLVMVNCEDVRNRLLNHYSQIIKKELDGFARMAKQGCDAIAKDMNKIEFQLRAAPSNIGDLIKAREFNAQVPIMVNDHANAITEVLDRFALLDEFNYKLSNDLIRVHWRTFSWPKLIHDAIQSKEATLTVDSDKFLKQMRTEQQEFDAEMMAVETQVNTFGQFKDVEKASKIAEKAVEINERLTSLAERSRDFNSNEMLLDLETSDYNNVRNIQKNFEPYYGMWTTVNDWINKEEYWKTSSFMELDGNELSEEVTAWHKTMVKLTKNKVIKDNTAVLQIAEDIRGKIEEFKPLLPLVVALRNPGMRDRHWEQLSDNLPFEFVVDEALTLNKITDKYKLQDHLDVISKIGESAGKEFQIESAMDKMEKAWEGIDFTVKPFGKGTDTFVIQGVDEIVQLLDEHIVMTQAMQFSAFKKPFEERIDKWSSKLDLVYEVIEQWVQVQRQWMSLQSIFSSPDINKQLPAEGKRFATVNKTWMLTMSQVNSNPAVLDFCDNPTLLDKFIDCNKMLTTVQKRLSEYLDKKRAVFSRFYFLANEELLQILSQTTDPTAVQPHLKKCFENLHRLRFKPGNLMDAMYSGENEEVEFVNTLNPNEKSVEYWLGDVENEMKTTIAHKNHLAAADYLTCPRTEWVKKWPGQCVLAGSQIHWTREVEESLDAMGNKGVIQYYQKWLNQLNSMVDMVRGELTKIERMIIGALIVLDVHARDVIERLVNDNVSAPKDFAWICQMRYYPEEKGKLIVQMVQSRFPYCWEYLGNTLRLVITPLTDRCYMTLFSALALHLGGAPAGPAGTGKTETVKDLSKAVAKQCVVFNCSDGLDFRAMSKFFKGLASSGAWACFDEFNRIDIEVLSVVAQQIQTIWEAIRGEVTTFQFEDTMLTLDATCCAFITMNPGYAGRTELPDNLEVLFRPVAMMVPDYALIGQIMLFSFGFYDAKALAVKMVTTFTLCSEQLSAQDHYDYGMRAVKTVITRAGLLKREEPDMDENVLLLRALRDVNVPKFLAIDLPLFEGIISDLFPGTKPPEVDYGALLGSITMCAVDQGIQPIEICTKKTIELYETTVVRHGLMLVGPTGGGKTTTIRLLQAAMTRLKELEAFEAVKTYTLNPKAVTMGQLYGDSDIHTGEWTDGILAGIMRGCIENESPAKKWVIFDGPVDAIWIENMNTVLDDNKKLCLVSGEILQLTDTMTMVFEVEDLEVASPATVSRCGMIYLEPTAIGSEPLVKSWLQRLHPQFKPIIVQLAALFDNVLNLAIAFARRYVSEPVPTVDNAMAKACMNLVDAFLAEYIPVEGAKDNDAKLDKFKKNFQPNVEAMFTMAIVWSVGASCDAEGRKKFSSYLRNVMSQYEFQKLPPKEGTMYDYLFDVSKGQWIGWMDSVPSYKFDSKATYAELIVPTQDSVRYTFFMDCLLKIDKQVLFTGNTGTGKTVNVNQYLAGLPEKWVPLALTFSAATSANQIEDMMFQKLSKRRSRVFGPPLGKKFVVFVDDLNMPAREKYFAQPPIEILRQWMDHGGWYDRHALQFVEIVDLVFVAAMGPPGGGRNPVTARFLRHFAQIAHADIAAESLELIFNTIVSNSLVTFGDELVELTGPIVKSTIQIYNTICNELLPTPAKVHYTFNLRDLSAVYQGVLSGSPKFLKTADQLMRLWIHENQRVFKDRLINNSDRKWLDNLIGKCLDQHFGKKWEEIVTGECLLFGEYIDLEQRAYQEVSTLDQVTKIMEHQLSEYNEQNTPMGLVMFLDAIEHVSRISRVLRQPGGNALLLGVGGSGRQSLTRLATFLAEFTLFRVEVSKTYSMNDWHEDLKNMLLTAGLKEQPTVFMFNDTQITYEAFLEDVNNILNSGDVPNLYSGEDMDNIFATCKMDCQRKKIPATKLNAFAQFLVRIKANLHIVLCMSPLGDAFRTRLRMFPALVNCCTIDWFADWPVAALEGVANRSLTEGEDLKLNKVDAVVKMFGYIHSSVTDKSVEYKEELRRHNYVTPTSYLELLSVFKFLLAEIREKVGGTRDKLQDGLNKLSDASAQVAQLQEDLTAKQPILVETQKEVADLMVKIAADQKEAAVTAEIVGKQEAEAKAKADECEGIRSSAQKELDVALPMLDAAVQCLKELNKAHIDEVRNFKKPPAGVLLTMEATCVMLKGPLKFKYIMKAAESGTGKVPDYWATAQSFFLKDPKKLLETLQEYDKDNIPEKTIKEVEPYIKNENFTVAQIEKASTACRAICMWCHAMHSYHGVSKIVEPKRIQLREAQAELAVVTESLNKAQAELKAVTDKVQALSDSYDAAVAKSEALENEVEMCKVKLERAEKLIGGLGGEKTRWEQTVEKLNVDYTYIVGDVLVSCGTIAYLGAFTAVYRNSLTEQWRKKMVEVELPHTEGCNVRSTLADPVQIRAWNITGLPTDAVSTENGIIISKARRWPLMIDPQGQAGKFIKNLGAQKFEEGMTILKLTDKHFIQGLENAIRFGKWVMIEAVLEELDPSLEPLLLQQIVSINGAPHVKLGENMIPYSESFHMYMTTNLPNPHYAPELQVKVTLLNFTITRDGLQDQMLGVVVAREMPEMEQKKNDLTVQNAKMKKQLQDIEDQILRLLSEASGDILEDETLINILAESKVTSKEINERVAEAEIIEKEIDVTRQGYIPVAFRASLLYFCIADLANIDSMYQYSLQWFVNLFVRGIDDSPKSDVIEERLKSLNDFFTAMLYSNVCRSLAENHKLLFAFLLGVGIFQGDGKIDDGEWRYLVTGGPSTKDIPNPAPEWMTDNIWTSILSMSELPAYSGFEQTFLDNIPSFKRYFDSVTPHLEVLPEPWAEKLTTFQKLLVLKCLRPDKMAPALQIFIAESLGPEYNNFPTFDLPLSFEASNNTTPLILVLAKGADPASNVLEFANDQGFREKFQSISLGQGQGPLARKLIEDGRKRGGWVLLQNCHLAVSWLPTLEAICTDFKPDNCHEDFRLWLTSGPTPKFPVSVLQNGVKMTKEPAKGLRANLMQSYNNMSEDDINRTTKPETFKKLLFSICFFHAIILDRRKFGPLGWNIPYAFAENDLAVCITQLAEFIDMYEEVPYRVIHFLAYDVNYGGRVTDLQDWRTIETILDDFMNPDVLSDDYRFSESGKYLSVPIGDRAHYLKCIEAMDLVPEPEVFGMHDNADITSAQQETQQMFDTILGLLPRSSSGGGMTREDTIAMVAQQILDRNLSPWDMESVAKKYPTLYSESMNTVLCQEAIRYNRLIGTILKTLNDLLKALKGEMVMTVTLEAMADSLFTNRVPEVWEAVAYPSLMPLANWVVDLVARVTFLQKWIDDGTPLAFWISGFFFPQAFLTGSLQNYARKYQKPIDSVKFSFKMHNQKPEEITEKPTDGIYIYGLFLQGCAYDEEIGSLVDSKPKELFTSFPTMWLVPTDEPIDLTGMFRCGIYKELNRRGTLSTTGHSTNFVLSVQVPTKDPPKKWVKAGVALFCALNY